MVESIALKHQWQPARARLSISGVVRHACCRLSTICHSSVIVQLTDVNVI